MLMRSHKFHSEDQLVKVNVSEQLIAMIKVLPSTALLSELSNCHMTSQNEDFTSTVKYKLYNEIHI